MQGLICINTFFKLSKQYVSNLLSIKFHDNHILLESVKTIHRIEIIKIWNSNNSLKFELTCFSNLVSSRIKSLFVAHLLQNLLYSRLGTHTAHVQLIARQSNLKYETHALAYYVKGSFFNYVDKTRQIGGTGNVNGMQIFPNKEFSANINQGQVGQ